LRNGLQNKKEFEELQGGGVRSQNSESRRCGDYTSAVQKVAGDENSQY